MRDFVIWLFCSLFLLIGLSLLIAKAEAMTDGKPHIDCGTLVGTGYVKFPFPDKTLQLTIVCPHVDL